MKEEENTVKVEIPVLMLLGLAGGMGIGGLIYMYSKKSATSTPVIQ